MMQNEHLRESSDLAEIVQRHLRGVHPVRSRRETGGLPSGLGIMPAILVEIGFGTNVEEARFIASPAKQRALADAIAAATREYLQRHERRVGSGSAGSASGAHD